MAKIYQKITELVGHTPLLELCDFTSANGCRARILAKLEYLNPAGSVKDRIAVRMIDEAEKAGILHPGDVIIEPTSGNTGIGLACVAAARGYRLIITMPETMSVERRRLLSAYGAKLVLTPASKGVKGAIMKANELADETGGFIPGQFDNRANPQCHYETTGPEIWEDTDGQADIYDEVITVSSKEAYQTSRELVKTEGFLCGVSSGAVLYAAGELAKRPENEGKTIVALFPDGGERYLSEGLSYMTRKADLSKQNLRKGFCVKDSAFFACSPPGTY